MKNRVTPILAAACLVLSGCSSNPSKDAIYSTSKQTESGLYGELRYANNQYTLSPFFYDKGIETRAIKSGGNGVWFFRIPSLEPAFDTKRDECQKTLGINGCEKWENKEDYFLHVNFTQSDYGNTPAEVRKILKEEAEKEPLTAGNIVAMTVAAAAGAAVAVGYGVPTAVIGLPLAATQAIVDPDRAIKRDYWIEFNHEKFNDAVTHAIVTQYGSIEQYAALATNTKADYDNLYTVSRELGEQLRVNNMTELANLSKYTSDNNPPIFNFSEAEMPFSISITNDRSQFLDNELTRIHKHYDELRQKQASFYKKLKSTTIANYKKQQKTDYKLATSSYQLNRFIEKYRHLDEANLIPQAKIKLKNALTHEKKERLMAQQKATLKRQKEQKQLAAWRLSVKVGDETFCGPVIDINQSMIKIAVRVQLPGYGNEVWLRRSELYPATTGCLNHNGQLSPRV